MRPTSTVLVVAGEQRHHDKTLHRDAQVPADHRGQPVGLALERQRAALELLVVLELDLEQPDDLEPHPGHAGDADARVLVRAEDLLDVTLRDEVAGCRPPVARP